MAAQDAEEVRPPVDVLAGWIAQQFTHTLASIRPVRYGPNTVAMAMELLNLLYEAGYEVRLTDGQEHA